ncbi:TPA: class I SAM-dependent methyltransferase [Yersinia enterocolitica]
MLIDEIDFAALYQQQLVLAKRTEKAPEHWDKRAEKMSVICANPQDPYLTQLIAKIDLSGANSLLDVGCGPGSVCLNVAHQLDQVYGIDYSVGMLDVAARRAQAMQLENVTLQRLAWESCWDDLPQCDIAVASRSTLVGNLRSAMQKIHRAARLRVYTTHTVSSCFVDMAVQQAIGRPVVELPNYIYAVNILYQMGIHARVDFIRGSNCQGNIDTYQRFVESVSWYIGVLNDDEQQRLFDYFTQQQKLGRQLSSPTRDWALIYWEKQQGNHDFYS